MNKPCKYNTKPCEHLLYHCTFCLPLYNFCPCHSTFSSVMAHFHTCQLQLFTCYHPCTFSFLLWHLFVFTTACFHPCHCTFMSRPSYLLVLAIAPSLRFAPFCPCHCTFSSPDVFQIAPNPHLLLCLFSHCNQALQSRQGLKGAMAGMERWRIKVQWHGWKHAVVKTMGKKIT